MGDARDAIAENPCSCCRTIGRLAAAPDSAQIAGSARAPIDSIHEFGRFEHVVEEVGTEAFDRAFRPGRDGSLARCLGL